MQEDYAGSCHCGALGFQYHTNIAPDAWSIRACQCSFCRAHDALSTSDTDGHIEFTSSKPEFLQRYRFGLKTADFLLCGRCGVYIGAVIETNSGAFGIINVHVLRETPANLAGPAPISYDDEEVSGRVSRREELWTPVESAPW